MKYTAVRVWALLLVSLGLGIGYYKVTVSGLPVTPEQETEIWTVQAKLNFVGNGGPAILDVYLPSVLPGYVKLDEDFISKGFGLALQDERDNRKAQWAVRRAKGFNTLYYRITVTESVNDNVWKNRPAFPRAPDYPEPYATAIRSILDDARSESADVISYTDELLQQMNASSPNENVELLRNRAINTEQWVQELINVLKGVRIPARTLWGLRIKDAGNHMQLEPMLQVHNGEHWVTFDPLSSVRGLPKHFFPWKTGDKPLYNLTGGTEAEVSFSVVRSYQAQLDIARKNLAQKDSFLSKFSLFSLPVQSQNTCRLLLMVPIGAMIVVLMRTVVGISTFGTFMPVLIALAFRETQLLWGLGLFTLIVAIGLMIRFYLERLMLLLVPRLTSILIIVVILMLLISLLSNQFESERMLSVALFPMVILAMTIERMSIAWEESGGREAMVQGSGSLLVAVLGYLAMTSEQLMYLMFVFPELLLVLLGISLWLGRYNGYRLVELYRFKSLKQGGL